MPRECHFHPLKLFWFEETPADVAFLEERNVGLGGEFAALHGQGTQSFERDEIAIDSGVRGALGLTVRDVNTHPRGGDCGQRVLAKRWAQVLLDANLERPE